MISPKIHRTRTDLQRERYMLAEESKRLRPLFLAWVGNRRNSDALRSLGIYSKHTAGWLGDKHVLDAHHQRIVREALDKAGVAVSPCS